MISINYFEVHGRYKRGGMHSWPPLVPVLVDQSHERNCYLPTVLKIGPYRIFFYASDRQEPIHVHIEREEKTAKFWLNPVRLQYNAGFSRVEIARLQRIVTERQSDLIGAWNAYFGN